MQDSLLMRQWAAHHDEFSAEVTALLGRGWNKLRLTLAIGSAYGRWSGSSGPALLAGTVASVATTVMIGVLVTLVMPSDLGTPGPADLAIETSRAGLPHLA